MNIDPAISPESLGRADPWYGPALHSRSPIRVTLAMVYQEHRVLLCLAFGYIASGGLVLTALGRPWPIAFLNPWFALVWIGTSILWLGWLYLRSPRHLRQALSRPRLMSAIVVPFLLVPTQITFQALKQSMAPVIGFHADLLLHRIDVALHQGMAWTWFEPLLLNPSLIRALDLLYMSWFGLLFLFMFWASWSSRQLLRQRALVALLLMWIGAGTVTAWVTSSAGPCYYQHVVSAADPYAPLLNRLDVIGAQGGALMARLNQAGLWEFHRHDTWAYFGGISAMPGLHVGIAVLFAVVALQRSKALGVLLIFYAALIQVGSVVLAWHYAVDGYLGAVLAIVCWRVAGTLTREQKVVRLSAEYRR
jgi:hypothetical protein